MRVLLFAPSVLLALALGAVARAQSPAPTAAAHVGIYEGAIGGAPVVVELGGAKGVYFYTRVAEDLDLAIRAEGARLNVEESAPRPDGRPGQRTGTWTLTLSGDRLDGVWLDPATGRTASVALRRVAAPSRPCCPDDYVSPEATPYEHRRVLALARFTPEAEAPASGPVAYRLVRDAPTGITVPRLTRHPDPTRIAPANAALDRAHWRFIAQARQCDRFRAQSAAAGGRVVTKVDQPWREPVVTYLSPTLLSFTAAAMYECGGAHPTHAIESASVDLARGLEMRALHSIHDTPPGAFGGYLDLSSPARRDAFDRLWIERLRAATRGHRAKVGEADDVCGGDILDDGFLDRRSSGASSYLLYFTAGGLAVHAMGWPFAAAVCYMGYEPNPVVIPYADLRPLATPAHPYADIR